MRKRPPFYLLVIYLAVFVMALYTGYQLWHVNHLSNRMMSADMGNAVGSAESERVIVEFLDYRCPACRAMHPIMTELRERNPDIRIIYRLFPVFEEESHPHMKIALAAGRQGMFEEAHNRLIAREDPKTEEDVAALIRDLGLDEAQFTRDRNSRALMRHLDLNFKIAMQFGIFQTPTLIIGDKITTPSMYEDGLTVERIEQLLQSAYGR